MFKMVALISIMLIVASCAFFVVSSINEQKAQLAYVVSELEHGNCSAVFIVVNASVNDVYPPIGKKGVNND